jgi:ribulose-5-phosphate 4-epimerase/fuculose-1-phosphate aldolase
MYAVGRDVAEGLFVATHLTQACQVQVQTLSMAGGDLDRVILPSGEDLSHQYKDMMDSTDYSYDGSREWPGIVRKVQREAPDYNL